MPVSFIPRREHLSREESIYPEKRAFIPRREHLSREESIYPEKRAFIPRREHLSAGIIFKKN
ncbi:hypothetical protein [Oceanobacillus bengalensis]|uniref:hypothetical protein n=1 Tax=Oceanobacillus bengalensis TaxID=1435466 RepID=UPI0036D40351